MLIDNNTEKVVTSVYRKPTFTGLLTNFRSFIPLSYKLALVKTLVHRIFCICNTWETFNNNILKLKGILKRNAFPPAIINREIKQYLDNKFTVPIVHESKNKQPCNYYRLAYIGKFSKFAQRKIKKLCEIYCKETNIKVSLSPLKIGSFFSAKDRLKCEQKSFVVYEFSCAGCKASYIGETTRHLTTRINEHFETDKHSMIYKHLNQNHNCKVMSNENCFVSIDSASTEFTLKIKEAIHIEWKKPTLNKQKNHITVTITI